MIIQACLEATQNDENADNTAMEAIGKILMDSLSRIMSGAASLATEEQEEQQDIQAQSEAEVTYRRRRKRSADTPDTTDITVS